MTLEKDTVIAEVQKTRACPTLARSYGVPHANITATAKAYQIQGNKHPHFSVTAEIYKPGHKSDAFAGGCLHEEVLKYFPELAPLVKLHLANADDGEPMHAEANGFYWLAGAMGGLGERYHGGEGSSAKSPDECLRIFSEHCRITADEAEKIGRAVKERYLAGFQSPIPPTSEHRRAGLIGTKDMEKAANIAARNVFHDFIVAQRDRWQQEAEAGIALLKELAH